MGAYIVISGSVGQDKETFEFEDTADGSETIAATIDAAHAAIIIEETVALKSQEIDALLHRMANALRERQYT